MFRKNTPNAQAAEGQAKNRFGFKKVNARQIKYGAKSLCLIALTIAAAVLINLLAGLIPASLTQLDTTGDKLYTLSLQTKTLLDTVDETVTVYVLSNANDADVTLSGLLRQYAARSKLIKIVYMDPAVYPAFSANYTDADLTVNSLIVTANGSSYVIDYSTLFSTTQNSETYAYTTTFSGESSLTSAINFLTNDNLPVIGAISGHGEQSLSDSFTRLAAASGLTVKTLALDESDKIPEDTKCLFINAPTADISESEKQKILSYLEAGGRMLLVTSSSEDDFSNLNSVMAYYGAKTVEGLVLEGNSDYCLPGYVYYLLPGLSSHQITDKLINNGTQVLVPLAQGLAETGDARDGIEITPLMLTSSDAYSKIAGYNIETYDFEEGDLEGPFSLALAFSELIGETETRIVWFGSPYFFDDQVNEMIYGGNAELFTNTLNWLCESESTISVAPKTVDNSTLTLSGGESGYLILIFAALLPLSAIIIGAVVRYKRKRR